MTKPLVSIITPCYNGEKFVHRLLDSILNQTYENMELIFVNDGSTDKTETVVLSYEEKLKEKGINFTYVYQENGGQASAINKGLKLFSGDYLTWPDSDDWLTADSIEKRVDFLENNMEYGLAIAKIVIKNEKMEETGLLERNYRDGENYFLDLILENNVYFAPIGYMVRSIEFIKAIPNKTIYESPTGQNWQLLLPIAYYSKIGYLDEVVGYYLIRVGSHSRQEQTTAELMNKSFNHEDCLLNTIVSINPVNKEFYIKMIQLKYNRKRFCWGFQFNDKKMLREQYLLLKSQSVLTIKDKIMYMCTMFSALRIIYNFLVCLKSHLEKQRKR